MTAKNPNKHFRASAAKVENALVHFQEAKVNFALQLGDIIEGYKTDLSKTDSDFTAALAPFLALPDTLPVHHVIGNHCLNMGRKNLLRRLGMASAYYTVDPVSTPGYRFLVLDSLDVGFHGTDDVSLAAAETWWSEHAADPPANYHRWNGGVGRRQLAWLAAECKAAREHKQKVVCFAHIPVHPDAANLKHIAWNHAEVRAVLREQRALQTNIVAWIAGHCHVGGYTKADGIHHLTLHGMVETPVDSNAYALVQFFNDKLVVDGCGTVVPDRVLHVSSAPDKLQTQLELFHFPLSHCSRKVRWMLEHMQLPYVSRTVNLIRYAQFAPEYAVLNPQMVVPTVRSSDNTPNPAFVKRNSRDILLWLNDTYGKQRDEALSKVPRATLVYWLDRQDALNLRSLTFGDALETDIKAAEAAKQGKYTKKVAEFQKVLATVDAETQPKLRQVYLTHLNTIEKTQFARETDPTVIAQAMQDLQTFLDDLEIQLAKVRAQYPDATGFLGITGPVLTVADMGAGCTFHRVGVERKLAASLYTEARPLVTTYATSLLELDSFRRAVLNWLPGTDHWKTMMTEPAAAL